MSVVCRINKLQAQNGVVIRALPIHHLFVQSKIQLNTQLRGGDSVFLPRDNRVIPDAPIKFVHHKLNLFCKTNVEIRVYSGVKDTQRQMWSKAAKLFSELLIEDR